MGVNFSESSDIIIHMNKGQVSRINMVKKPSGTLYPLGELEETKLKDFQWLDYLRPKTKNEIFFWKQK